MGNFGVVVLVAGSSRRMGFSKMLACFKGKTLLDISIELVKGAQFENHLFVTGFESEKVEKRIAEFDLKYIKNPDFATGVMSSIQCGIKNLPSHCEAVLIHLGDMPLVSSSDVHRLANQAVAEKKGLARFVYNNAPGHPVYITKKYWPEILTQPKIDVGCRFLFQKYSTDVLEIEQTTTNNTFDVDSSDDLKR